MFNTVTSQRTVYVFRFALVYFCADDAQSTFDNIIHIIIIWIQQINTICQHGTIRTKPPWTVIEKGIKDGSPLNSFLPLLLYQRHDCRLELIGLIFCWIDFSVHSRNRHNTRRVLLNNSNLNFCLRSEYGMIVDDVFRWLYFVRSGDSFNLSNWTPRDNMINTSSQVSLLSERIALL